MCSNVAHKEAGLKKTYFIDIFTALTNYGKKNIKILQRFNTSVVGIEEVLAC